MNDNMTATPAQKKELTIDALKIAGFTEKENYQGMYTQEHGMKTVVVDLNESPVRAYFNVGGKRVDKEDELNTLTKVDNIIIEAEDGRTPTKTDADIVVNTKAQEGTPEQPDDAQTEPVTEQMQRELIDVPSSTNQINPPAVREPAQALTPSVPSDLSVPTIKKYINDKATDEEAYVFLQLCKARGLNPFLKEAYLIKYDHVSPATMVVGKDAFMKRAELHPEYDGFEAGIIVEYKDTSGFSIVDENRVGTFLREEETLLGGWAKVYRKDHTRPVEITVSMKEFNTGKSSWKKIPATMIRKVALVQGHREAFPSELSGMYDQSEMGVEVST